MLFVTSPPSQQSDHLFVVVPVKIKSTVPRACADRQSKNTMRRRRGRHARQYRGRLYDWSPEPSGRVLDARIGTPLPLVALVVPQLQSLVVRQ